MKVNDYDFNEYIEEVAFEPVNLLREWERSCERTKKERKKERRKERKREKGKKGRREVGELKK